MTDEEKFNLGVVADKFLKNDLWTKTLQPFFETQKVSASHKHMFCPEEEQEKWKARYIACDMVETILKEAIIDGRNAKEKLDDKAAEKQEKLRRKR